MSNTVFYFVGKIKRYTLKLSLALVLITSNESLHAQESVGSIILPTDNDGLFTGDYKKFFMFVDRNFENQQTTPWEGGQYGFVRGPVRLGQKLLLMSFHEGIDIAPVHRDARGAPLDEIRAISDGKVVYTLDKAGGSNYGKYIVVEHQWGEGPMYSLYAHLSKVAVHAGDIVKQGQKIGVMGYTGSGLDRRRSHLHLELNLFMSSQFNSWHKFYFGANPNQHGLFNGLNLTGLNVSSFYLEKRKNPALRVSEFVKSQEIFWKVLVPKKGELELLKHYPWLATQSFNAEDPSWELWFSDSGLPVGVSSSSETLAVPRLTYVKNEGLPYTYGTKGMVSGAGEKPVISPRGHRYLELILGKDAAVAPKTVTR